jgi:omega-hydroxy-beta-dihydromenaquinone-9 sulfotransferase
MKLDYKISSALKLMNHTAIGTDLITWLKVLWKCGFSVQLIFLPKALFITATALFNSPFQLFERLWFSKRISRTTVKKPLFILGHPRSGTTFLQYLIGQDPRFAYCSTFEGLIPHFFLTGGKALRTAMQSAMPETRPQDNVRVSATLPVEEEFAMASISGTSWVHGLYFPKSLFEIFEKEVIFSSNDNSISGHWKKKFKFFLKKLACRHPDKTLLLKSPANTGRLKEIHELFPDARFIHIHRDPYEVYQSAERLYEKILPILAFHKVTEEMIREYIFYFYERIYKKYLHDRQTIPSGRLIEIPYH